jgi:hemoglobin-like flavoprotein
MSSMGEWWHDLWNDPMRENPWALGMLVLILVAIFAAFEATYRVKQKIRRRKQETSMTESKPGDRENWPTNPTDDDATEIVRFGGQFAEDKQAAADAIAVSRTAEPEDGEEAAHVAAAEDEGEETGRLNRLMRTDPRLIRDPLGAPISPTSPDPIPFRPVDIPRGDDELAGLQPGRNILAGDTVTATAPVPAPLVRAERETCEHCGGTGYVPSISDYLRESIALVGGSGDQIIRAFYSELISVAPDLTTLFPRDLLTVDEEKGQRDKLLRALIALSDLYDPADEEKMGRLDTALKAYGRSHAAFARPNGEIKGATWEEYAAVKEVLFRVLVAAAGAAWKPEYTASWSQAYDYAAAVMVAEQYRSGFSSGFPRYPRG